MISKKKSNRMAAIKALFVLPLSALAVVAFASEKMNSGMEMISNAKITEIFTQDTIKIAPKKEVKVIVNSAKQENGALEVKGEKQESKTKKVITYMVSDTITVNIDGKDTSKSCFRHGYIKINNADTKDTVTTFVSFMNENNKDATPLCIVDGNEVDVKVMKAIDPGAIFSISVLKDKAATEIYGDKGKNGVLVITLKDVSVNRSNRNFNDKNTIKIRAKDHNDVLYVIDGKVVDSTDALGISPDQIKSMSVLKGDMAKAKYGDKVKKGVVVITLKK